MDNNKQYYYLDSSITSGKVVIQLTHEEAKNWEIFCEEIKMKRPENPEPNKNDFDFFSEKYLTYKK